MHQIHVVTRVEGILMEMCYFSHIFQLHAAGGPCLLIFGGKKKTQQVALKLRVYFWAIFLFIKTL